MKIMKKENLTDKAIWDFKKGDTIYISKKNKSTGNMHTFLCEFLVLVRNTVYGRVLEIDKGTSWDGIKVGDELYADMKNCALYGKGVNEGTPSYHWFNTIGYAYKEKGFEKIDEVKEHPSFGMVGLSRSSSSHGIPLFASNIQHQNTITLTIKTAENNRHLNNDWIHGKEKLIEIELSGSQFAELITSFNMGDGVPCTIRQFNHQNYPDPPYENPIDVFQKEFSSKMKNLSKELESTVQDTLTILREKQSIGKADREFIAKSIASLMQEIGSNIPFVSQQFIESMDKTVSQAKTEVETFVTNKMMSLGIDVTKTNPQLLLGGFKTNDEAKNIDGDKK